MPKERDMSDIDPNLTYGNLGFFVYSPSKRWLAAGVKAGDFIGSTSITGALTTGEKIQEALAAPKGTILLIERMIEGKPERVTVEL
jgi:hypothetical protein